MDGDAVGVAGGGSVLFFVEGVEHQVCVITMLRAWSCLAGTCGDGLREEYVDG
jgi:hypothetical protein